MIKHFCYTIVLCLLALHTSAQDTPNPLKHTRKTQAFNHPGILHANAQLDFMRKQIETKAEPQHSAWEQLKRHRTAKLSYKPDAHPHILRGPSNRPNRGANEFLEDAAAAYTHSLLWYVTQNKQHAEKAIEILNDYSRTVKEITHHDARLLVGMAGIKIINAAELIKHTSNLWSQKDQQQFNQLIRNVLYPVIKDFYPSANGNWDASMIQTMLAMGIFLDDHAIFNKAANYYLNGQGNGAVNKYFNHFGQCQETGRDQAHTQMGLGYLANAAEIAWNQNIDLYAAHNNRLLLGYEYTAKYNLGHDVPYETYTSFQARYKYKKISSNSRGRFSPIYERIYHHFTVRKKIPMPYTKQVIQKNRPERYSGAFIPWSTLTTGL